MTTINSEKIMSTLSSQATLSLIHPDNLESFYGNGDFEYVNNCDRIMYVTAWKAISLTELWDFIKKQIETFMFSNDSRVNIIYKKIESLGYKGHSGASFGSTMRAMQYISKFGEKRFKEDYLQKAEF